MGKFAPKEINPLCGVYIYINTIVGMHHILCFLLYNVAHRVLGLHFYSIYHINYGYYSAFDKYTPLATDKPFPFKLGVISSKLPLTLDSGRIVVEYTWFICILVY